MFRDAFEAAAFATGRLQENNAEALRRKDENARAQLIALIALAIQRAWASSPGIFPANFNVDAAAVAAVDAGLLG